MRCLGCAWESGCSRSGFPIPCYGARSPPCSATSPTSVPRSPPSRGPPSAPLAPLLVALALAGWMKPALVAALFLGLELLMGFWIETAVFAGAAGVSQVPLLIAVAFWAWLWGPFGIVLATPLTVCLAVMG